MLSTVADADYGAEADKNLSLLERLLNDGTDTTETFAVREVLEIARWNAASDHDSLWVQLFSCCALIQMAVRDPESFIGECTTAVLLVHSALSLDAGDEIRTDSPGHPIALAAARFLAARFKLYQGVDEDRAFIAFGILLLAVRACRDHRWGE